MRPGEKLYEELLIDGEDVTKTHYDKIWILKTSRPEREWLNGKLVELEEAAGNGGNAQKIKIILSQIVPEYTYETPQEPPLEAQNEASPAVFS